MTEYSAFLKHLGIDKKQMLASMWSKIPESEKPSKKEWEMTREELFKKNFPEYVTEKGECLSPYWDLFSAGIECATYELNKGCIQALTKENAELKAQIEQLQKINSEQKETLKKVRVALIKERAANIMNYGKGGVEMFDSLFEILKGVSN